jgi:hypothetical protein
MADGLHVAHPLVAPVVDTVVTTIKAHAKRAPKGERIHVRRQKQAARKGNSATP